MRAFTAFIATGLRKKVSQLDYSQCGYFLRQEQNSSSESNWFTFFSQCDICYCWILDIYLVTFVKHFLSRTYSLAWRERVKGFSYSRIRMQRNNGDYDLYYKHIGNIIIPKCFFHWIQKRKKCLIVYEICDLSTIQISNC